MSSSDLVDVDSCAILNNWRAILFKLSMTSLPSIESIANFARESLLSGEFKKRLVPGNHLEGLIPDCYVTIGFDVAIEDLTRLSHLWRHKWEGRLHRWFGVGSVRKHCVERGFNARYVCFHEGGFKSLQK